MTGTRYWMGVASRDHVKAAQADGFCQFCHGKALAAQRLAEGNGLVYYSASESMGASAVIRSFTAIGQIRPGKMYQAEQSAGFHPWRQDVDYWPAEDAAIEPLLGILSFSANNANWGCSMRRGIFEISQADFVIIAQAMKAQEATHVHSSVP